MVNHVLLIFYGVHKLLHSLLLILKRDCMSSRFTRYMVVQSLFLYQ